MKVEISVLQLQRFINKLKNIPTAYDQDKVVEELEELKMIYFLTIANTGDEKSDFAYENVGNALDKAIEIVKQGGVADANDATTKNDDVCEWKEVVGFDDIYIRNPHTNMLYSNKPIMKNIYCNTCGKKIKAVK